MSAPSKTDMECLRLRTSYGLTFDVISERLGISVSAVKAGIGRAQYYRPSVPGRRQAPLQQWDDERRQRVLDLWHEGWSASQIAKEVGAVSRNAVIGVVHRANLAKRTAPSHPLRAPKAPKPAPTIAVKPPREPKAPPVKRDHNQHNGLNFGPHERPARVLYDVNAAPAADALPLERLGDNHCRWPLGDPQSPGFGFCGKDRPEGKTYCCDHARVAYQPPSPKRSSRELIRSVRRYA